MIIDPHNMPQVERNLAETRATMPQVKPEGLIHPERLPDTQRLDTPTVHAPVIHDKLLPGVVEPVTHLPPTPTVARPVTHDSPTLPITHDVPKHTTPLPDVARPVTHDTAALPTQVQPMAQEGAVSLIPDVVRVDHPPALDLSRIVWRDGPQTR